MEAVYQSIHTNLAEMKKSLRTLEEMKSLLKELLVQRSTTTFVQSNTISSSHFQSPTIVQQPFSVPPSINHPLPFSHALKLEQPTTVDQAISDLPPATHPTPDLSSLPTNTVEESMDKFTIKAVVGPVFDTTAFLEQTGAPKFYTSNEQDSSTVMAPATKCDLPNLTMKIPLPVRTLDVTLLIDERRLGELILSVDPLGHGPTLKKLGFYYGLDLQYPNPLARPDPAPPNHFSISHNSDCDSSSTSPQSCDRHRGDPRTPQLVTKACAGSQSRQYSPSFHHFATSRVLDEAAEVANEVQAARSPIALLKVGIYRANDLLSVKIKSDAHGPYDVYVLAKYGLMWLRTRSILDRFSFPLPSFLSANMLCVSPAALQKYSICLVENSGVALYLLLDLSPLQDPDSTTEVSVSLLDEQFFILEILLMDNCPYMRVLAVEGCCRRVHWEATPSPTTTMMVTNIFADIQHDICIEVRFSTMLDIIYLLRNHHSLDVLQVLLLRLGNLLLDNVLSMRLAAGRIHKGSSSFDVEGTGLFCLELLITITLENWDRIIDQQVFFTYGFFEKQIPVKVRTGCCFNRQGLYGYNPVLAEEDLEPIHLDYFNFSARIVALALLHTMHISDVFDRFSFVQLAGKYTSLDDIRDAAPFKYIGCSTLLPLTTLLLLLLQFFASLTIVCFSLEDKAVLRRGVLLGSSY